jgi:hypothetical protein
MTGKNDLLDSIIFGIETTLSSGQFQDIEDPFVELKDLSSGNEWTSLK